jgi:hypothetical protein
LLDESLNKKCIAFKASGIEHDRRMREFFQQFEMPGDRNQPRSGEMMSDFA